MVNVRTYKKRFGHKNKTEICEFLSEEKLQGIAQRGERREGALVGRPQKHYCIQKEPVRGGVLRKHPQQIHQL